MTADKHSNRLCDRCGEHPAVRHSVSVLGPLDIREDHFCLPCQEISDSTADPSGDQHELTGLGPIDFAVLRRSILRLENAPNVTAEEVAFAASFLDAIATAHGQVVPMDIRAFLERESQ